SIPGLPNAMKFENGKPVKTPAQWRERREELLKLLQHYVIGTVPPAPGNVRAVEMKARQEPGGVTCHEFVLEFGPGHKARLHVELLIPKGNGPFPVFITQDNHRRWALIAASRGYIGCVYAGADSRDDTPGFIPLYPEHDWTKLARRAWAASRCVDYLHTLPMVDKPHVALTGHSRNGKLSLIGAALDERITAVISSSAGAGGPCPWRFFSETQFGEGIELITRNFPDWEHPRLRFFAGREHKLPVDQHELVACIAPRHCLISTALNDNVESVWSVEQTYHAAVEVYSLLDAHHELNLRYRSASHETRAEDIEAYLDWLDTKFGRVSFPDANEPHKLVYPSYIAWLGASGEDIDPLKFPAKKLDGLLVTENDNPIARPDEWLAKKSRLRIPVEWSLGQPPPLAASVPGDYGYERAHAAKMLGRDTAPAGLQKTNFNFGNYINGDLWFPAGANKSPKKMPVVIWLHPISNSNGYVPGYKRGEAPHLALARLGFAVFAFDQIGNGSRIDEVKFFYGRYPNWSLLGKTVADTRAAVDALLKQDFIDPQRIWLVGYDTGAKAALHAAALDDRIAGVVSVAGFTPMRLDTADNGTGGLARHSEWLPLQPRLGAWVGNEPRVPYDYHELIAMIAPRPVLVVAPTLDLQANNADVRACVAESRKVFELFGAAEKLQLFEPEEFNRFSPELQKEVYERLRKIAGL
ncbi:MAG: alpha/beta fold hydrolase, partial [Verrucomicrobia bacterium]|nr:alpha/beta fold hydrolase [Verrucomicrobiota bacterium]